MGLPTFLAGYDAPVTFDLSTLGFVPTSGSYSVNDEEGNEIIASTVVDLPEGQNPALVVTVPASFNQMPPAIPAAWNALVQLTSVARTVFVTLTGTGGTVALTQGYRIVLKDRLIAPQNTFQTLQSAQALGMDIPNLPNWASATDDAQIGALVEARNRIGRLTFRYQPDDWQMRVTPWLSVHDFDEMLPAQWLSTDYIFKVALRRAQVIEADDVLGDAEFYSLRLQGVTEIKIGDSQRVFSRMRRGKFVLCDRAMKVLSKFIGNKLIGRA